MRLMETVDSIVVDISPLSLIQGVQRWLMETQKRDASFAAMLASCSELCGGLSYSAFLILPLQRGVAYGLLLGRLLENTPAV